MYHIPTDCLSETFDQIHFQLFEHANTAERLDSQKWFFFHPNLLELNQEMSFIGGPWIKQCPFIVVCCVTAFIWTAHCESSNLLFGSTFSFLQSFSLWLVVCSDLQDSFSPHPNTQVLFAPCEDLFTVPSSSSSSLAAVNFYHSGWRCLFFRLHQSTPLYISMLCYCVKCTCATLQVVQWTDSIVLTLFSALSVRMYQVVFLFSGCEK